MSDRMGGYGLIGVVFARLEERSDDVWEVETWLMSCRTLGRQMEKFMFDRLVEAAIELGIRRIKGVYMPTKKNSLVKELFDQMGFRRVSESGKEVRYEFDVPEALTVTATHVRNTSAAAAKVGA